MFLQKLAVTCVLLFRHVRNIRHVGTEHMYRDWELDGRDKGRGFERLTRQVDGLTQQVDGLSKQLEGLTGLVSKLQKKVS